MAEAAHHAGHLHLARSEEDHLQNYITFNPKGTAFGGINGVWLVQNVDTGGCASRSKSVLLGPLAASHTPDTAGTAAAIAIAGTARKKRRASSIDVRSAVG